MSAADLVLAGDLGGTKTDIAVFSLEKGVRAPLARATFENRAYSSLDDIAVEFLQRVGLTVVAACFDVAGPVTAGRASITNLPWTIEEQSLREALNIDGVRLLNDLEATALAVPLLQADELHTLAQGQTVTAGPIAVIAPGTGLGEAYLTWDGTQYRAYASEGGHADFAPTTLEQVDIWRYLHQKRGMEHVSYEQVCSGIGIQNLYRYLIDTGRVQERPEVVERLGAVQDQTPIIVECGLSTTSEVCMAALDVFASILGAEAGNLALKLLATGGVYVGGGLPPRMLQVLDAGGFMRAFRSKGRLSRVLSDIPVHVILSPAPLMGAAQFAFGLAGAPTSRTTYARSTVTGNVSAT